MPECLTLGCISLEPGNKVCNWTPDAIQLGQGVGMCKDGGCKRACAFFLLLKVHGDSEEGKKSWFVRSGNCSSGVSAEESCPGDPRRKQMGEFLCDERKHLCRFSEMRWDEEENSWPGCRNGRNAKQQGWPFCAGFPCLQCFHPSQPSPDSPYQEPADAYSKQQPGHSILLRKSTIKLWCFKHYSWWNPHSIEGNAKTTSALMEQVFSPSYCFSDQISVPFVTHSIFLKLFRTFSEEIKLISSLLVLTFL